MQSMIELHPKPHALQGLGLPAIPYPVALPAFQAAVANDGELPLADMLHGLQLRAADAAADWRRMEPAMARLAELLARDDARESVTAAADDWWLEVGPVDLDQGDTLTLQRGHALLAAIAPREDGRLRVAAYRPLDGRTLEILLALAVLPASSPDAADARTCWERAQEAAAGGDPHAPSREGLTWLSHRAPSQVDSGNSDGRELPGEQAHLARTPRKPACVLAEIRTFHTLHRA